MTQITLPPNNRAVGTVNPPGDMNLVTTALMAMSATSYCTPTADTSGASDAANINAAITAGGLAVLGPGTYYLNATIGPLATNQWVLCAPGVLIYWKGTGDCFRFTDTSTYTARTKQGGGILGRPIIDGTSDGAGSCALHAGDILGLRFDIAVQNFSKSGDVAIHLDNENYWTEQARGIAYISNCTQDVVFDCGGATTSAGSYDRGDFTFYVQRTSFTASSITWQNGAYQFGGWFRLYGNYSSSNTTFTEAVLSITGAAPGGHPASYSGLQCGIDINIESDEGLTYTYQTINFGSANNTITDSFGSINFGSGNQFTQSNVSAIATQFTFLGPVVGDSSLEQCTIPTRLNVDGQMFAFSSFFLGAIGSAPSTPASGGFLYVDSGNNLHYVGAGGQNTELAGSAAALITSGQFLCAPNEYAPSTQAVLSTTSATMAALSSANINTGSFTAPPSGDVLVTVAGLVMQISADADEAGFGLCAHGTVTPMVGHVSSFRFSVSQASADSSFPPVGMQFRVTGLTPGTSYNLDLMWAVASGGTLTAYACETTSVTPPFSNATLGAPVIMSVQAI